MTTSHTFREVVVAEAVQAERIRCIKIAQDYALECMRQSKHDGKIAAMDIAALIKTGG